jgi:hypothetical protein
MTDSLDWTTWLSQNGFADLFDINQGQAHPFDGLTWGPRDADSSAAWELYTELRTRIATQPLAYRAGDEGTALTSVYRLFEPKPIYRVSDVRTLPCSKLNMRKKNRDFFSILSLR